MGGLDIDFMRSAIAGAMLAPHGFAARDSALARDGPDAEWSQATARDTSLLWRRLVYAA
jgi:hypothetical protein